MNARPPSALENDEFALAAHYVPFALYQQMLSERGRGARYFSRLATLHAAHGDNLEAYAAARYVLKADSHGDAYDTIRAHITCGTYGSMLFLDTGYRIHFLEAVGKIREAGFSGSDLHVATMINWACSQIPGGHAETALRTFDEAEHLARSLPHDWPLRSQRIRSIEINRTMLLSPADQPGRLFNEARVCERESLWALAGICH